MAPPAKNSKPIFKTASPFTETKWYDDPQNKHHMHTLTMKGQKYRPMTKTSYSI
jgi:hypothetical protein